MESKQLVVPVELLTLIVKSLQKRIRGLAKLALISGKRSVAIWKN
jgi:hypothetical protein